ncbi:MAG: cation:proton antiporter [Planctomycetota bacterium]
MGPEPVGVLVLGLLLGAALALKALFARWSLPPPVAYLLVGLVYAAVRGGLISEPGPALARTEELLRLLGEMGLVVILFRIGLESDCSRLVATLGRATPVWIANLLVSAAAGYAAGWALGYGTTVNLVLATALSATSVGIPAAIWQERGVLRSPPGELFVDVAELDDVSGIVILGILLAVLQHLGSDDDITGIVLRQGGVSLLILVGIAGLALVFSRWVRPHLMAALKAWERGPDPAVSVVALVLVVAALTAVAGLSLAIGAFVAGLALSPDRETCRGGSAFRTLYDTLVPFFFVAIAMQVHGAALSWAMVGTSGVVLVAAVGGKILGTTLPALPFVGLPTAVTLGMSMVPRAEITMIIAMAARDHIGDALYAALVFTSLLTAIGASLLLPRLFTVLERRGAIHRDADAGS